jgi:two-component system CheB/CheR fusion protein
MKKKARPNRRAKGDGRARSRPAVPVPGPDARPGAAAQVVHLAASQQDLQHGPGTSTALAVVGMVASAGGLDAFKRFFHAMPADSGIAFVLVPHLDRRHESYMVPLLAKQTAMAVSAATEGAPVQPDHVYVVPPNKHMRIKDGALHLSDPLDPSAAETSLDIFLRSLGEDQQERALCVVLSGTGSHGTLGLKAIKANGGMAMVQEPRSAEYDAMPRSAVASGLADFVLPVEEMPAVLIKYVRHFVPEGPAWSAPAGIPPDLTPILALLRARTKFDFRSYRKGMLLRRVQRRMGLSRTESLADYARLLRERPEEVKLLSQDLLISVTNFFRDREMYQVLEAQVIPELLQKAGDAPLRVWVPGCATGEEAYSIGMLFLEQIAATQRPCPLQIFATDIDESALAFGRRGVYTASELAEVGGDRAGRFFVRLDDQTYQVSKPLRDSVLFASQNILRDAPFSKIDLISCRNLLIYLEPEVQQKVVLLLHFALREGGFLALGPSETVGREIDLFDPVSKKWRIYRRRGGAAAAAGRGRAEFPIQARLSDDLRSRQAPALPARAAGVAEMARERLLEDYAPAAALINRDYEILYFHGPTHRYLRQPGGAPTLDLMSLARDGLRPRIRAAVQESRRQGRKAVLSAPGVKRDGSTVTVRVSARPVRGPRGGDELLLVTFEDEAKQKRGAARAASSRAEESIVKQLEFELKSTREELQSAVEELESSNEELKASNEEAMSMNEELQSANEELETSKEELQSLNEELNTVNNQLQEKLEELESTNNDLANLLSSADIATLFLGPDYRIKRFSAAATRLFKLIPGDVGRPIGDIVARFADPDLPGDVDAVIGDLAAREKEVRGEEGRWYLRRVTPYRTLDNRIEGVVVAFTEVTKLKELEAELRRLAAELEGRVVKRTAELAAEVHGREDADANLLAERNFVSEVLATMPALVMVTDRDGLVVRCNRACEEASGRSFEQVRGKSVFDLLVHQEDVESVKRTFAELVAGGGPSQTQNTWQHADGTRRVIAWSNNVLRDDAGRVEYIIRSGIDITERHRAEDEARQRLAELAHMHRLHTAGELATALAHELNQPLAAIAGYSDACLNKLSAGDIVSENLTRNLEQISTQAQRAGKFIHELRSFLAKGELRKEPTDANALARQAFDLLSVDARARNVRLESDLAESLPKVMAAALSIEHVLVNLVSNGIEAVRASGADEGTVAIRTRAEKESIKITVTDSGRGVAPEVAEKIFEPFYTTKQDGLGMGLRISRSIVESHGGRIWAEAGPQGMIHLILPVSP